MLKKRRFPRFKVKLPVKLRIFDKENKTDITNDIDVYTENVSRGGMCLVLPRGWDCPECNNCLGWMYNLSCKLKNNDTQEADRFIPAKLNLKISVSDPSSALKEPIQLLGNCVWVKTNIPPATDNYLVGVNLAEPDQKRISAYLSSTLRP